MTAPDPHAALRLIAARNRMTRAVLATLIGPAGLTASYGGSLKAAEDYAEMTAAARDLAAAQDAYDALCHERAANRVNPHGYDADGKEHLVP